LAKNICPPTMVSNINSDYLRSQKYSDAQDNKTKTYFKLGHKNIS
jgi:hypothetical protein